MTEQGENSDIQLQYAYNRKKSYEQLLKDGWEKVDSFIIMNPVERERAQAVIEASKEGGKYQVTVTDIEHGQNTRYILRKKL